MKKVSTLQGAELDAWVANAVQRQARFYPELSHSPPKSASTNWAEGGPILERYPMKIARIPRRVFQRDTNDWQRWHVTIGHSDNDDGLLVADQTGKTLLIAAMRAFVEFEFGAEVPDEHG